MVSEESQVHDSDDGDIMQYDMKETVEDIIERRETQRQLQRVVEVYSKPRRRGISHDASVKENSAAELEAKVMEFL